MTRSDHPFTVDGDVCAAWLYRPAGDGPVPCVVLAHGFGMTRACRLPDWAERFAAAGLAALVFDYRRFGDSGGEPRQVLDIAGQRADIRAALAHVRATPGIDPARVALWGTSFGGGHVLAVAAGDPGIAAVVAQVPFVDGPATLRAAATARPPGPRRPGAVAARVRHTARLFADAVRDGWAQGRGRPPVLVPVTGGVGSGAVLAGPEAEAAIRTLVPAGVAWRNEIGAGVALRVVVDRPGRRASRITCPLLVGVCDDDVVAPAAAAAAVAAAAPDGELRRYPFAHFEAYVGAAFEALCADQVAFLTRHLRP